MRQLLCYVDPSKYKSVSFLQSIIQKGIYRAVIAHKGMQGSVYCWTKIFKVYNSYTNFSLSKIWFKCKCPWVWHLGNVSSESLLPPCFSEPVGKTLSGTNLYQHNCQIMCKQNQVIKGPINPTGGTRPWTIPQTALCRSGNIVKKIAIT